MKSQREIKGPRKVHTNAIIKIDRAHRSHSTREAKQNKTNKKNQGSPIKTKKSHDSILVPLLGPGVLIAGFLPAMPFPTHTYKCVGGSRSVVLSPLPRLVARRRLASSSSLCQEVIKFSAPCNTPLCHGTSSSTFAARVIRLLTPNVSRFSTVVPSVAPKARKSSLRQVSQFCSGRHLPGSSPPD